MKNILPEKSLIPSSLLADIKNSVPTPTTEEYIHSLYNLTMQTLDIEGDIVELGVAKGRNSIIFGKILKSLKSKKKYYGFDTFKGVPKEDIASTPPDISKKHVDGLIHNEQTKRWCININSVKETIAKADLNDYVFLIEGNISNRTSCEKWKS